MSSNIKIKRICQQCGKEFEARTTVTRTCSDTCANRAYKARKRAEKIESSNKETCNIIERPLEVIQSKDFLNIADTCKLLGISRWTLWRAVSSGNLNAMKLGRRTLIRRMDIDRLFDAPAVLLEQNRPVAIPITECYTMKEIQHKYGISEKALYNLIKRNNIPKQYSGIYAYVPKSRIDELLTPTPIKL